MKDKTDMKFDKRAASYDGFEGKLSGKFYKSLLAQVQLSPKDAVLDVGCGTGALLKQMANTCEIEGYGIDVEEQMVLVAKKQCPSMSISVASSENTPFADNTFDVITACMAYHHFSDQKGFAKEAARILKENGRLYIADPNFPFVIRKTANGLTKLFRVHGHFESSQETGNTFREYGFVIEKTIKDTYVQVVTLKKQCSILP